MSRLSRDTALTLAQHQHIDRVCLAFEDRWLAGEHPLLETHLQQVPAAAQSTALRELLLLELDYRRGVGERPEVADYLRRFPAHAAVVEAVCATALARDAPPRYLPGRRIGRYRICRVLGTGAFAAVYLAWDDQLQREVAIKVPHAARRCDAAARQRFLDEARVIARVRHPRLVAIYDAAELPDGTVFLVMQYVAGQSLRQRMDREEIPAAEACAIIAEVADAVDAAHRGGVIHRDLKPSNILLDEGGQPHVCDFGLALAEVSQGQRRGEYAGTLAYMPPEQLRGESDQLDGRADIWSAGVMLYELLTGRTPFPGRERRELAEQILQRDPRPPRQIKAGVSRAVERVCLRCLEKRPAQRYSTAADLADDLRRAVADHRSRRQLVGFVGAMAALLALAALGGWLARHQLAGAAAARLPLRGQLELLVWDLAEPLRQGVALSDPRALPLRSGDRVRLTVELNQAAFAYVVWLDADGRPAPVYPWLAGDWARRPAVASAAGALALPDEPGAGWPLRMTRDGMETLLLLARRTPLPEEVSLPDLLRDIAPVALAPRGHVLQFLAGEPLPARDRAPHAKPPPTTRDPVLDRPVALDDPLLSLQRQLHQRLQNHFELIRAVSFPVRGD
ncbi:MAG: serine/threonine-protein kinase [Pirellulaceae bacterium]|nr:serine/threonine-protein kinase [Pirellulaceae bacterium]